jgi:hypothetical protein
MKAGPRTPILGLASIAAMACGVLLARMPDAPMARAVGLLLAGAGLFLWAAALRRHAASRAEAVARVRHDSPPADRLAP